MDVKRNQISQTLWILTIVIVGLLLLSFLPEVTIGSFTFKKIDILGNLHPDKPIEKTSSTDTLTAVVEAEVSLSKIIASVNKSITQIEDYSIDRENLSHFYRAVKKSNNQQIRVALFGDSFIEGDIISASFRDTLQKVFGGVGVGLVPLASETAGFRKSIKHTFSNWDSYSILTSTNGAIPLGISGYTFIPKKGNTVLYKPGKVPRQENFRIVKLFYQNSGSATLTYTINSEPEVNLPLAKSDSIKRVVITHNGIESIQFNISPEDSVIVFGTSFESTSGIYVDNFSMRRNSGIALAKLDPDLLTQFNNYLNYKLIILQYGLNVASENDSTNYAWYTGKMTKIIKDLKEHFPKTSFLLLGVSDRGVNKDGNIVTMESIPKMRNMQREIAKKSGIAFWDMFEAMGGRNSIVGYTESEPPQASKDYTHLTHLGGNKIGKKLAEALLHELTKHEKKNTP